VVIIAVRHSKSIEVFAAAMQMSVELALLGVYLDRWLRVASLANSFSAVEHNQDTGTMSKHLGSYLG
jgi:hypothetical protein